MKTKAKTLILILLLTLTMANIINIRIALPTRVSLPQAKQENEEPNLSLPITPEYKYNYENDFDLYWFEWDSQYWAIAGDTTEWSQNPNDNLGLDIGFSGVLDGDFSMSASLYVVSHNTFQKQGDSTLGAYVDFHIDIDEILRIEPIEVRSIDLTLNILVPVMTPLGEVFLPAQLLYIYNMQPQTGRFYIPNFDLAIASDGYVRFALTGSTYGSVPLFAQGALGLIASFQGLRVVQEIKPKVQVTEKKTLIFVHGYGPTPCVPANWASFFSPEFLSAYDDIIVVNYVGYFYVFRYLGGDINDISNWGIVDMNESITTFDSIGNIASVLKRYIIHEYEHIEDNVDFICHSMGGLVTRYMIKHMYDEIRASYAYIQRDFKIKNVAMLATPNHGIFWIPPIPLPGQQEEMKPGSAFLNALNYNPETGSEIPASGINITWFTYTSGVIKDDRPIFLGLRHDGMVDVGSVPLVGTPHNKGWYQLAHETLRQSAMMKTVLFNDLIKPPAIIDEIFDGGAPGIIMGIDDLTLQPNYEEPGGKTLLSITLPAEVLVDIVSSTLTLYISTDIYQMTLKAGTSDTYEVELPIADGDYSFLITADLVGQVGRLYQMSGYLKIIDDDVSPPVIQMTPGDLSISDEDAVGGVLVSWNISDYSGISEANVLLNGVEIRSYTNQGTITDSYLLPNEHGVYTILVWARDNDGDPEHDPSGGDWLEYSIERTITIYDDDPNPPDIQITPGDLTISVGEAEGGILVEWEISDYSGISEANVLLNGTEIRYYTNQGTITDSFLLANEPGVYNFLIWAKDNDNDLSDDWLEDSTMITITIHENDTPPPAIPGYSIFILLGIFSVVIILISKKRRNYKI